MLLTDEEIEKCREKCREKAAASYNHHRSSIRGQQVTEADDPEMHLIWAVIAAYEAKLREQEPVAIVGDVYQLLWFGSNPIAQITSKHGIKVGDKLFANPAPIPEGWKELMIRTISRMRAAHVPCADIERSAEAMLAAARSG